MNSDLNRLEIALHACRSASQSDVNSPCHEVTQWQCYVEGIDVGLVWPSPFEITGPVEILFVGINPNWSLPLEVPKVQAKPNMNSGKAFSAYEEHIVRRARTMMPAGSLVGYLDLVPCGTPNGGCVVNIIDHCRVRFFDKTVRILKPKVIIAIGRYASEHLYWHDTVSGNEGKKWTGLRNRHATTERALLGDHECTVVFALQPSSRVSTEKRNAAMEAVAMAYYEQS